MQDKIDLSGSGALGLFLCAYKRNWTKVKKRMGVNSTFKKSGDKAQNRDWMVDRRGSYYRKCCLDVLY